jgi:hypothetical protein
MAKDKAKKPKRNIEEEVETKTRQAVMAYVKHVDAEQGTKLKPNERTALCENILSMVEEPISILIRNATEYEFDTAFDDGDDGDDGDDD